MSIVGRLLERLELLRAAVVRLSLRAAPSESQRVFVVTLVLGGVCGLVAVAFHEAILLVHALTFAHVDARAHVLEWLPWIVGAPTLGGLVGGVLLHRFAPLARGSGIPQVKAAYALDTGGIRFRDVLAKFGICVLQLGTGASLGREGPTVQICAGVASSVGRWLALSPANLRRLLPVGAAAGVAAAFNAPIAAVTFTIEEIVGTLDGTVLSGVVVAAALAAVVEHSILGGHPVLAAPSGAGLHHASSLVSYAVLGVAAGFVSIVFCDLLLGMRARFRRADRIPGWAKPAVGGLVTGALAALAVASTGETGIVGGGYETLTRALHGQVALHVLGILCVLKLLATVSSYSSGSAGGIFAPTLFLGAMLGGAVGHADVFVLGHVSHEELSSFALVGMGAVFAGVVRAPMTSVLIVFEMTGGYELVLPLMIANVTAYTLARRFRPLPIYEALLAQDGVQLPHGVQARGTLGALRVSDAMTAEPVTLDEGLSLAEAHARVRGLDHGTYPVVNERRELLGLLSEARMERAIAEGRGAAPVVEHARRKEHVHPDETLLRAVARMQRLGARQLAVVERGTGKLAGILAMSDVLRAQVRASEPDERASRESIDTLSPSP